MFVGTFMRGGGGVLAGGTARKMFECLVILFFLVILWLCAKEINFLHKVERNVDVQEKRRLVAFP